jgi:OHCU decarboxylase
MDRARLVAVFGGVFEHSPWIAEAAFDAGIGVDADSVDGLHAALAAAARAGSAEKRMALVLAHPDLAGRLALAGGLTAESTSEQASAGLDRLTADELARFTALNEAYKARFGIPFIIAVRGLTRHDILAAFERRLTNGRDAELAEAHRQIEKIALLRLRQIAAV